MPRTATVTLHYEFSMTMLRSLWSTRYVANLGYLCTMGSSVCANSWVGATTDSPNFLRGLSEAEYICITISEVYSFMCEIKVSFVVKVMIHETFEMSIRSYPGA